MSRKTKVVAQREKRRNLLYYPYINLPETSWTVRTLLYYDTIATIVPDTYYYDPDLYEPQMRELVESGLVTPVIPMAGLKNPRRFTEAFIRYLQSPNFRPNFRREKFEQCGGDQLHQGKFTDRPFISELSSPCLIHANKFEYEILYSLEQMGLAKDNRDGWYAVEKRTADELMLLLATELGDDMNFQPVTDKIDLRYFNRPVFQSKKVKESTVYNRKRDRILKDMIPLPLDIDYRRLRDFKEKNRLLLESFILTVEEIVYDPVLEPGSEPYLIKIDKLTNHKEQLVDQMKRDRFDSIVWGTLSLFFGSPFDKVERFYRRYFPKKEIDVTGMKYLALAERESIVKS